MSEVNDKVHIFGIRHHGPGSARSLLYCFEELKPDCILIEGPPEGNNLVNFVTDSEMTPPVAMLIYASENTRLSVYYPFAVFSPEWQAMRYGSLKCVPVRFMDLPQSNWLALDEQVRSKRAAKNEEAAENESQLELPLELIPESKDNEELLEFHQKIRRDPLNFLAEIAGFSDGERWWENLVEQRRGKEDVFGAIREAMRHLRAELPVEADDEDFEHLREAQMRQTIRAAIKEGFQRIAVVCGAWHAPALENLPPAKEDTALLKGMPKVKVEATWIPWTHGRLAYDSGYGAGVSSPGWYHHLWTCEEQVAENWMSRVARLLRDEDLDASSAHIIESVRLAETLAALRGHPLPGLNEFSEATQTVLCFGNPVPMQVIHEKLIVGEALGEVPSSIPGTPLQKDLEREQKRLRMPAQAQEKLLDLDLRNANDLARSHLLHRLVILGIDWGSKERSAITSSTFHEYWRLRWKPELSLGVIEAGIWGRSVAQAAEARARDQAEKSKQLSLLTRLLDEVLLADLPDAVETVIHCVESEAALAIDVKHLMQALPNLVQIARYGNVRKTDLSSVMQIIEGLIARICVGLPPACSALDDAAAQEVFDLVNKVHSAISLLQSPENELLWEESLNRLAETPNINGLLAGRANRLLFDWRKVDAEETARRFGLAVSTATEPSLAASFVEGFLHGSGLVLIHDRQLFSVADQWLQALSDDAFTTILPLMRRTFSSYAPAERRQIGESVARSRAGARSKLSSSSEDIDQRRADLVLPVLGILLGLSPEPGAAKDIRPTESQDDEGADSTTVANVGTGGSTINAKSALSSDEIPESGEHEADTEMSEAQA